MELKNQDLWKKKKQKDYWGIWELKHHWIKFHCWVIFCFECIKMNEVVNKFLLAGDKFIPEMHLKQRGSTYSACGPFTKKSMQTGNTDFIYINDLDKACLQHDTAYGKSKDLTKRIQSGKGLKNKSFNIASNPEYDEHQRGLALMVYKFFDQKSSGREVAKWTT